MIKRLIKCIREYKMATILSPFFITLEVLLEVMIPFLMAHIIDSGVVKGDMGTVMKTGLLLFIFALLSLLFGVLAGKYAAYASAGLAKNIRKDMYYNIQGFSFSNIDKFGTPSLITRLSTDITNIQNAFQMMIRVAVRAPVMMILALFMAFRLNSRLAFVFFAFMPVLIIGIYLIMSNVHPIFKKVFKLYDKLNKVVQENLRGIRVVKSFVREDYEIKKFEEVSEEIYADFTRAEKIIAFNAPLMQFCMYGCSLLISWFGAKMIVSDTMTTGQLISFMAYIMQILMSLMMVSMVFLMLVISRAAAQRIVEVLNEESSLQSQCNDSTVYETVVPDGSVVFENVSFSYGAEARTCLEDINITINTGETVGIIGGTGSGKTTLISLIPRLYDVLTGMVKVGGIDVKDYDLNTLRNQVAVVLQKNELFSGTIKENLKWGNKNATDEEIVHACELAQADGFIRSFPEGYDTYIEQGGSNVSGGQKQRLCIARALLKKPKILIFDDSTSAVDTKTDALIRRAFEKEIPDTTKIIIAQRISSVEYADKIIVMDNGRINAVGNHDGLMDTCQIYKEVYESQIKGGKIGG